MVDYSNAVVTAVSQMLTAQRAPTESAFFPVALFVAVVGEGVLDPSTPSRVLERLQQASSKVPKEQIIRIPLCRHRSGRSTRGERKNVFVCYDGADNGSSKLKAFSPAIFVNILYSSGRAFRRALVHKLDVKAVLFCGVG